ncbi:hypothetical protein LPJ77_002253 [Coemansia sp. RSA 2523]|nr:hypothetical protein LPJ77_002253 [Coemansia sp. RSA 2523]KAJ2147396.1 hypothetical protein IW142_001655 [Coemansia sp. RSA 564]KAJ2206855.1 hypothetical protein IW145_001862 [Coemansia sp. RSA 521]KAJ2226318.1 hypothetical protein EV180_002987 [Coemansia sp. RSA 518]KAJ2292294.1 hypothetical protein IW141_002030 [Coemansia sp. RSA 355]KAJ2409267.1 hypothetical protein J3F80_001461 [Coemansia sp. RSA 2526]
MHLSRESPPVIDETDSCALATNGEDHETQLEGQSTTKVGFNVLNTIIGSGVLCLPYALHNAGFFFGLVMLGVIAVLSQFSLYALVVAGKRTGTSHFSSVTQAALGNFGYHLLNYSMIIDMVGTVILYLMIIGDMVTALANIYLPITSSRTSVIMVVSLVVILPLLFFRNTGPLARLSVVSILCLPYIILAVALRAPQYSGKINVELSIFGPRILPAMGVLAFTYSSCHAAFPNYLGLKNRSVKAWVQASSFATAGATTISTAFAITGYLSFGSNSKANILENFPDSDNFINLGRLLFAISLIFTTPLGFYPIRDTVTEMLKIDPERHNVSRVWESICTVVLFAICAVAAALCTDLGLAYELIGALSSSVVNFLLPALVYLWAGTNVSLGQIISKWKASSGHGSHTEHDPLLVLASGSTEGKPDIRDIGLWILAWTVAAFGVWVMVLGTYNIGREL